MGSEATPSVLRPGAVRPRASDLETEVSPEGEGEGKLEMAVDYGQCPPLP